VAHERRWETLRKPKSRFFQKLKSLPVKTLNTIAHFSVDD
jgi:hypothetical protein